MSSRMRPLLVGVAVVWVLGVFVLAFLGYFVISSGPQGPRDGLGRPLSETPAVMRLVLGQERMWAGWGWLAVDTVVFWGSVLGVVRLGDRLSRPDDGAHGL